MYIKPIRTKADYSNALRNINKLLGAKPKSPQADELEVLTVLVEDYERKHFPIDPPDPIEAIKFRMEQMDLSKKDLEACIGSRARVSEILNHKRRLTLTMIRSLHNRLGIPVEALIG
ncbi:MAG TPA: transcriptional regulator [Myxococcota bacterium]|nr:transcriptional regulator [Myxococcota bacterium]